MDEPIRQYGQDNNNRLTKLEIVVETQSERTSRLENEIQKVKDELIRIDDKVDKTNLLIRDEIINIKEEFTNIRLNMLEKFSAIENQLATTVTKMGFITASLLIGINLIIPLIDNFVNIGPPNTSDNQTQDR